MLLSLIDNNSILISGSGQGAMEKFKDDAVRKGKKLRLYIYLCLGCVVVSTVIVIFEAYALLALQFCDGEDLMSLYWSTWMMIQVGSLIAMVGIILAMCHSLKESKHPPWALALGTPVLVIAGFLHLFHTCTKSRVRKIKRSMSSSNIDDEENAIGPPMSQACVTLLHSRFDHSLTEHRNTIQAPDDTDDESIQGEFIGFTVEGGPIVRFNSRFANASFRGNMELLGYCNTDRPIVAYRKDSIKFLTDNDKGLCPKRVGEDEKDEEKVREVV